MKIDKKKFFKFILYVFILTLFSGIFFTLPELLESPTTNIKGFFFTLFHLVFICFFTFFILYLFSLNKTILTIFLPLFFLLGTSLSFFRIHYGAMLTPMLIDAVFQNNDVDIYIDFISPDFLFFCFLSIICSIFFVWCRRRYLIINNTFIHLIAIIFVFFSSFFFLTFRMKTNLMQHFPFSVYSNTMEYYNLKGEKNVERNLSDSTIFPQCNDSLVVVFIIGESLRADHLQLNEYERETNPILSKNKNLISLPNIYSEYTHTNASVSHILSSADSVNLQKKYTEKSFISLFNNSGYCSSWLANQNPTAAYISFVEESDTIIYIQPEKSVYGYSSWLDEDILPHFDFMLKNKEDKLCKLILIQTIGSHWYYNSHYPSEYEVFLPVTKSKIISQCSKDEIINSYDNTVLYTDYFISEIIERLADKRSVLIYLSDHGESLGEGGRWLHASNDDVLRNPACLVWMSDKYRCLFPDKYRALVQNKDKRYRTDFLFHSILSAADINSSIIENKLNVFITH